MHKFEGRRGLSPAAQITAAIIEKLEQGTRPWAKPWRGVRVSRPLRSCGTPYRGVNTFWLWMIAEAAGFMSPYWMTYRQCQKPGGQVRKGEKSTIAIFYKSYDKQVERAEGEEGTLSRRVLKAYAVFNADQCDDPPALYRTKVAQEPLEPAGREERLDAFFSRVDA
jgi:antirestriction protein ArdC